MRNVELLSALLFLAACKSGGEPVSDSRASPPAGATVQSTGETRVRTEPPKVVTPPGEKSLYDRLGGRPAIDAVITEFRKNVNADEKVNAPFGLADHEKLHKHLVDFVCAATGGPCQYSGRSMKASHEGMQVTN